MHMSVTVRKSPGMRMIHHDFVISALSAFESMLPHEICSSGRPIPMKLKVDSAMIALLIFMTTINMIEEAKFGVRCFHKTCQKLPPIHLAAMTYPLFRICFTFRAYHFGDTWPARDPDNKRNTENAGFS